MDIEQRVNEVATKTAVLEATIGAKLDGIAADTTEIKNHLRELNGRTRKNEDAILVLQQAQAPSAAGVTKAHVAVGSGAAAGIVVLIEVLHQALPAIQQLFAK